MRRHDAADSVLNALREHGPMNADQIMREARLLYSQFRNGIAYIDETQDDKGEPRIYDPHRKVYALPTSLTDFQPGLDWRLKTMLTILRRVEKMVTAAQMRFADDPRAQQRLGSAGASLRGAKQAIEDCQRAVAP